MTVRAKGGSAVMAERISAKDIAAEDDPVRRLYHALNFFPTPPWATRALFAHVIPDATGTAWDPACGKGHMAHVLTEHFRTVYASDVHDYGGGQGVGSFVGEGPDVVRLRDRVDWIVSNPPFALALEFAARALETAHEGVALLVRTTWLEGQERWERLFRDCPPAIVAVFVERVPMTLGRWDPEADTATAYAWIVWRRAPAIVGMPPEIGRSWSTGGANLIWIPHGCRTRLEHPDDRRLFAEPPCADGTQPGFFDGATP